MIAVELNASADCFGERCIHITFLRFLFVGLIIQERLDPASLLEGNEVLLAVASALI